MSIVYKRLRAVVRNLIAPTDQSDTRVLRFAEQKIAYIPIPKAANSSIRRALLPLVDADEASVRQIQRFDFDMLPYSALAPAITDEWFVFTVVRNPYSRFVSAFIDKVERRPKVLPAFAAMGIRKGDSIETFARVVEKWPRLLLNDHIMPQSLLLSRAMSTPGLSAYRMEDLAQDWSEISGIIANRSGKSIGALGRSNARGEGGPHWREYLTPPVQNMVNRVYAGDFAAFGYDQEIAPQRARFGERIAN